VTSGSWSLEAEPKDGTVSVGDSSALNNKGDVRIFTGAFIFAVSFCRADGSIGGTKDDVAVGDVMLSVKR